MHLPLPQHLLHWRALTPRRCLTLLLLLLLLVEESGGAAGGGHGARPPPPPLRRWHKGAQQQHLGPLAEAHTQPLHLRLLRQQLLQRPRTRPAAAPWPAQPRQLRLAPAAPAAPPLPAAASPPTATERGTGPCPWPSTQRTAGTAPAGRVIHGVCAGRGLAGVGWLKRQCMPGGWAVPRPRATSLRSIALQHHTSDTTGGAIHPRTPPNQTPKKHARR